jgi:hypothetical protein
MRQPDICEWWITGWGFVWLHYVCVCVCMYCRNILVHNSYISWIMSTSIAFLVCHENTNIFYSTWERWAEIPQSVYNFLLAGQSRDWIPVKARFSTPVQTGPEGKTAGAWRWPHTPSSAEVKEGVDLWIYPPLCAFVACCRVNFTFTFHDIRNTHSKFFFRAHYNLILWS